MKAPRVGVTLRELEERHLEAVAAWATDPLVTAFLTWDPGGLGAARRWILNARTEAERVPRRVWELAACDAGENVIGSGRLSIRDPANRSADIGYVVRRDHWGHGFGTAIAEELITLGFQRLQLHRIWATCIADNLGSARVLEKSGMRLEGRLRDHVFLRGRWRDSLLYAIVRDERAGWRR